jgi:RHS repeat-associated protein
LTRLIDGSGVTTFDYDGQGRLVAQRTRRAGIQQDLAFAYDGAGRLTALTYPSGRTVEYRRDSVSGRVTGVTLVQAGGARNLASDITYAPFGPLTGLTLGNGIALDKTLDLSHRVASLTYDGVVSLDYQYDRADNIAQIDDRLDAAASQAFAYDAESRLTQADGRYGLLDFAYDDNGNRTRLNDGGRLSTYSYLANSNKLKSIAGDQARSFDYNANGDINRVADILLAYGDHDRVIRAQRAGVTLGSYVYNGLGQRVRKATAAGTRHFQYSPDGLLLGEYDGAGRTIQEYVYLDTMPLAILGDPAQAWRVFFAHTDHLDTLVKVTNGAGNLVWDAERRPFGETTLKLQRIEIPLRFPGQYYDAETGLYYNYFRDYDPSTGRYIQSDPIGLAGGLNTYAYVGGNPLTRVDPDGRYWRVPCQGVGCLPIDWPDWLREPRPKQCVYCEEKVYEVSTQLTPSRRRRLDLFRSHVPGEQCIQRKPLLLVAG